MATLWQDVFERMPPADESLWHKWNVMFLPVRTIDGGLTWQNVWRRKVGGRWQYKDRPETEDEQLERMSW